MDADISPALRSINRGIDRLKRPRSLKSAYLKPEFQENIVSMSDACSRALTNIELISRTLTDSRSLIPSTEGSNTSSLISVTKNSQDNDQNDNSSGGSVSADIQSEILYERFLNRYQDDLENNEDIEKEEYHRLHFECVEGDIHIVDEQESSNYDQDCVIEM